MDNGSSQLDVAHPLTADLGPGYLNATALADNSLKSHPLVLAAIALPVLGRTEDLLAEESVLLRTKRAVVNRLRLLDLTVRPPADRIRSGQTDPKLIERVHIKLAHRTKFLSARRRASSSSEPRSGREMSIPNSSAARKTSSSISAISIC